ncbi:AraC family transcriptional regulator [Hahella sp. CCB-MM4]|uniref:GlxA family transcriptional regulator n=1 Tax=Hahella sp. (strain CCB-MM4) TaxID=1926491 RepID=UPI000B9A9445|nr:GlxA family transcriptional regulator [Hahella sp. CCB-MM4]OZG74989.1 AraC family transcriptional regulator [Hahella sp. CCB-MM4]
MQKVTILGFDLALSSAITGIVDILSMAGVTWNFWQHQPTAPRFQVQLASVDGGPVRCLNKMQLEAHLRFDQVEADHILVVPTIAGEIDVALERNRELIETLAFFGSRGSLVVGNCTGVFLLAEAGILDGKVATTHWAYVEQFKQRYPKVDLRPEQMITTSENVYCSGGGIAWLDMALYLTERFCGHDMAVRTSKSYVIDMGRTYQSSYSALRVRKMHRDEDILKVQDWLEEHCQQEIRIDDLAQRFNMSPRTLARRFKAATGDTPLGYLQTLRLENAKKMLEETSDNISQITMAVGYEDVSSFTKLFRQKTGLTPKDYRNKFQRRSLM